MNTTEYVCQYCNKLTSTGHRCTQQFSFLDNLVNEKRDNILNDYKNGISILELTKIYSPINRKRIENLLKSEEIFNLPEIKLLQRKNKLNKLEATNLDRYGVRNIAMTESHRKKTSEMNKSDRWKISHQEHRYIKGQAPRNMDLEKYQLYTYEVWEETKKYKRLLTDTHCYYTGLPLSNKNNPNCDLRRSIDHKNSILFCFSNGISAKDCGNINNLCITSRYVNSYKQSMTEDQFRYLGYDIRIKEIIKDYINENSVHL